MSAANQLGALFLLCLAALGTEAAFTPAEWTRETICQPSANGTATTAAASASTCGHEPSAWRWRYVDELAGLRSKFLVRDQSTDARLANMIYVATDRRYYDYDIFRFNSGDPQLDQWNKRRVAGPRANESQCRRHLAAMAQTSNELQSIVESERRQRAQANQSALLERHHRLVRVLDSFGRYESGQLLGQYFAFGQYDECISSQLQLEHAADQLTSMRFCWAKMNTNKHLDPSLKSRRRFKMETEDNLLHVAVCIPESCHSKDFEANNQNMRIVKQLVDTQFKLPESIYIDQSLELDSVFCLVDQQSDYKSLSLFGRFVVASLVAWVTFVLWATYWNSKGGSSQASKMINCFDLHDAWDELMCKRSNAPIKGLEAADAAVNSADKVMPLNLVEFNSLSIIRLIGCLLIILGHSIQADGLISLIYPMNLPFYEMGLDIVCSIAFLSVDWFFVITGMMMAYRIPKQLSEALESGKLKILGAAEFCAIYIRIIIWRYLRLVPIFALFFALKKTVLIYTGSGLFRDYGLNRNTNAGGCVQESWWDAFMIGPGFAQTNKACVIPGWYFADDMIFSVVTIPIIMLLVKRPKSMVGLSAFVAIASSTAAYLVVKYYPEPQLVRDFLDMRPWGMFMIDAGSWGYVYSSPQFRISAFMVGIIAGYALYCYERDKKYDMAVRWSFWFRKVMTRVAMVVILFLSFSSSLPIDTGLADTVGLAIHSYTTFHLIWSICFAILFVRWVTDQQNNLIGRISSNRFVRIMTKLVFIMILIHHEFIFVHKFHLIRYSNATVYSIIWDTTAIVTLTTIFSVLTFIFLERPIRQLINMQLNQLFR